MGALYFRNICLKCGARRVDAQLGLERVPDCLGWATKVPCGECFVCHMVAIFREVRRVLRPDGTLWLNLGDSYAHNGPCGGGSPDGPRRPRATDAAKQHAMNYRVPAGLKPKDLVGMPWRCALALQADGWWLRQDIIWAKPNPMPESVNDRCTKSHEYIFLLTKGPRYFYDSEAVKEDAVGAVGGAPVKIHDERSQGTHGATSTLNSGWKTPATTRNRRSVWTVATVPYSGAHFATFPPGLVRPMIEAGTSAKGCCPKCGKPWERVVETRFVQEGPTRNRGKVKGGFGETQAASMTRGDGGKVGHNESRTLGWRPACKCGGEPVPCTVLDPFAGSGTTLAVAAALGREAIGIELNPEYVGLIRERVSAAVGPMFAEVRP